MATCFGGNWNHELVGFGNIHWRVTIGFNPLHMTLISLIATSVSSSLVDLPIHFNMLYAFSKHFGLSGLTLLRLEKDGSYRTNELGIALGPAIFMNHFNNFFIDIKRYYY